jgi:hypothetical protein
MTGDSEYPVEAIGPLHRHRRSRDLPPYWAILAVDAKDFSGRPSVDQSRLNADVPQVLDEAFHRARIGEVWQECRFAQHTGDGYVVAVPADKLPYLLDPLLSELQSVLEDREDERYAREPRLRLRVSLNVGPLPDYGQPGAGVGQRLPARTEALGPAAGIRPRIPQEASPQTSIAAGDGWRGHPLAVRRHAGRVTAWEAVVDAQYSRRVSRRRNGFQPGRST